nr:hypothetical protein [Candidatus Sigynarchaeota archaeon]
MHPYWCWNGLQHDLARRALVLSVIWHFIFGLARRANHSSFGTGLAHITDILSYGIAFTRDQDKASTRYGLPAASRGWLDPQFLNPDLSDPEDEERRLFFVGITRAKDTIAIITWQGQESRFLDVVPPPGDIFKLASRA